MVKILKLIFTIFNDESDKIIFNICNSFPDKKIIKIHNLFEVIIPPLEYLYAIKKSHIHRILPLTRIQSNDIKIWEKHMKIYLWIRNKMDYKLLDRIIYGSSDYTEPLPESRQDKEKDLYFYTRLIFLKKFNETNKRTGETELSMSMSKDEFFNDNVTRYIIDHDKLHEKIGILCRKDSKPIFAKYQIDPNSVELDLNTFLLAKKEEKINMIVEEVMVLFLERVWLQEIQKFKEKNINYLNYVKEKKQRQLKDVISNFVTNLCGMKHYSLKIV
jgi:hypothetical protein